MTLNKYLLTTCIWLVTGCVSMPTYHQIVDQAKAVTTNDGISEQEARVLAQNYLIESNLDANHSVYRIGLISQESEYWLVHFNAGVARGSYRGFVQPVTVKIDINTGVADTYTVDPSNPFH